MLRGALSPRPGFRLVEAPEREKPSPQNGIGVADEPFS